MKFSYRFYTNYDCEYLPCHEIKDLEKFNCMFCYCPLYFLDCGGNYIMTSNIKDCSQCLIPHDPKGYDYINEMIIKHLNTRED